jgi:hypothetical protein
MNTFGKIVILECLNLIFFLHFSQYRLLGSKCPGSECATVKIQTKT